MKRLFLVILAGLLFNTLIIAQVSRFEQRGNVTQEMSDEGFRIAHPSLPLQTQVMIANTITGKEIEATVTGRISASPYRIADLSYDAWYELDLSPYTPIRIFTPIVVRQRPPDPVLLALTPEPVVSPPQEPEPVVAVAPPEPEPIIVLAAPEPEPVVALAPQEPEPEIQPQQPEPVAALAPQQPEPLVSPPPQPARVGRQRPPAAAAPEPVIAIAEGSHIVVVAEAPPQSPPISITIHTHITTPPPEPSAPADRGERTELSSLELKWLAWLTYMLAESRLDLTALPIAQAPPPAETHPVQPPPIAPPPVHHAPVPQPSPGHFHPVQPAPAWHAAAPAQTVRIIPGLPDPGSGRFFNLQVGAFSSPSGAATAYQLVRDAGFYAVQEPEGNLIRVFAVGISAPLVFPAAQRLGAMGFTEVWVR